jgi:hypothetical protein
MKKFVFISLILALAASVAFAQDEGSWSVSGGGEINTLFNFRNRVGPPGDNHISPLVGAAGYNMYGYYGSLPTGKLGATYSKGDLSAGLAFETTDNIYADVSYNSGDIAFNANIGILDLFMKGGGDSGADYTGTGRLWGYYKFLDGKVHLEVAVNSRDTNYWISNEAVGNVFNSAIATTFKNTTSPATPDGYGIGWGFASVDHHNYILVDFAPIEGLQVGFMLPGVFASDAGDGGKWAGGLPVGGSWPWGNGTHPVLGDSGNSAKPLYEAFQLIRFGAKYSSGPAEVALQFAFTGDSGQGSKGNGLPNAHNKKSDKPNTALYLGGFYTIADGIRAGLAMEATFSGLAKDRQKDGHGDNELGIAASFNYNAGALSAGLEGGLYFRNNYTKKAQKEAEGSIFGVRPQIAYNIIENYLCLSLDAFFFTDSTKDYTKNVGIGWEFTPELWFNVAGTGAGKGYYWPNGTAIIVRYKVGGWTKNGNGDPAKDPFVNAMDITFKWNF